MGGGTYGTGCRAAHALAPMLPGGRRRRSRKARTGAWGPDTSNILRLDLVTQVWESRARIRSARGNRMARIRWRISRILRTLVGWIRSLRWKQFRPGTITDFTS